MAYDQSKDPYASFAQENASSPARGAAAVTPHDTNDLTTYAKALYVGGAGDVKVIPVENADASPITFVDVPAGTILPVSVRRVYSTGTVATDIIALL
jgi:hypothetical protein